MGIILSGQAGAGTDCSVGELVVVVEEDLVVDVEQFGNHCDGRDVTVSRGYGIVISESGKGSQVVKERVNGVVSVIGRITSRRRIGVAVGVDVVNRVDINSR